MTKSKLWIGNKICCFITGASRGLGKSITIGLAQNFKDKLEGSEVGSEIGSQEAQLSFVLLSRDIVSLQDVSKQIHEIDPNIKVVDVIQGSLDDPLTIASFAKTCQTISLANDYNQVVLVHNAGSLGDINILTSQFDPDSTEMIHSYFEINLFSVMKMTGVFLNAFNHVPHQFIINISSLAAQKPFKGLSLYCTGKASRDAFFRSVAEENPDIIVLNYAPGPLETEMVDHLKREGHLQEIFNKIDILKPETTTNKLLKILNSGNFSSGDHIDYYDFD